MRHLLTLSCLACLMAAPADAQEDPIQALRCEQLAPEHWRCAGHVELAVDGGKFFADEVDWHRDTGRIEARGNVVFAAADGRIAASRVEYDSRTGTGTFHEAAGLLSLGDSVDRAVFGHQEPDLYFHAERIEKTGPREYRLTRGRFSTCVQPTPRWEVASGTVTLRLDDYAIARHMTFRVKGVPVLYLPILYYPLHEDDRATGFLMPSYGTSTLRGQAISNAFFWAIDRSQDATFVHDWFTRTGHGAGVEYRYVTRPGSSGTARVYRLGQRGGDGLPDRTSLQVTGAATHALRPRLTATARIDYFSDVLSQQLFQQDVYQASRTTRTIEAGLTGHRGPFSASLLYQRNENFADSGTSVVYGSTPRVGGQLAPQRLFGTPVYASLTTEYAFLPFRQQADGIVSRNDSLHRMDVAPAIRLSLSRLTFLSVQTHATYRATYYSRSVAPGGGATTDQPFLRRYATTGVEVIGPVIERLFDAAPGAPRVKHVVEPVVGVDYTSALAGQTPVLGDLSDVIVGGSLRLTYGLNSRLVRSGAVTNGARGQGREVAMVGVQQTYYSNPEASVFDTRYMSALGTGRPLDLSPIAVVARVMPSPAFDASARLEYDVAAGRGLQALTAGAGLTRAAGSTHLTYSRRQIAWFLPADDFVSSTTAVRLLQGRVGGTYALHWDLGRGYVVSQRAGGTYLAQCCGIEVEYQTFNFPPTLGLALSADRRVNASVVLAGLGTFSNFLGAFGLR
jgi:LPS-assembly protein